MSFSGFLASHTEKSQIPDINITVAVQIEISEERNHNLQIYIHRNWRGIPLTGICPSEIRKLA